MQQHKIVEDYLDSVVPQKLSQKTEEEIREEIRSHIYDRADFYMEIGYDEETALKKAVEQMGEAENVKAEFSALYRDSVLKAILLFFGICTWNMVAVTAYLGYMNFVDPVEYDFPSVAFLVPVLAANVFLIVYTIKCVRQKLQKQFLAIIWAFVLISLGSFVTSGIFFPVINAGKLIIKYITNGAYPTDGPLSGSDLDITIVNIILVILYTALSFRAYDKMGFRNKPYRLSLNQITVLLSAVCLCFTVVYGFAYAKYEWSYTQVLNEAKENEFSSDMTTEQRKIYDDVDIGDKITETGKILTENGFVKQNKNYKGYMNDCYFPFWVDDYLSEKNPENTVGSNYSIYSHTIECEFKDIISCIVVSYNANGEIWYKLFIPDVKEIGWGGNYLNYSHGEETGALLDNLQKGDSFEKSLDFIRSTGAYIIEDEKYNGESTVNTYKIYFECFYPLEPDFWDLFWNEYDEKGYEYDFEIEVENGIIKDFKITDKVGI